MPIMFICHNCNNVVAVVDYDVKVKAFSIKIARRKRKEYRGGLDDALSFLGSTLKSCPYCKSQLQWDKPKVKVN